MTEVKDEVDEDLEHEEEQAYCCVIVQNVAGAIIYDDREGFDRCELEVDAADEATENLDRDYFFYDEAVQDVSVILHKKLTKGDSIAPVSRSELKHLAQRSSRGLISRKEMTRMLFELSERKQEDESPKTRD